MEHELSRRVRVYEPSTTVTLQLGTDPGKDTMLDDFYSDRNYGGSVYLQITGWGSWLQRPVLQFDLTTIPADVKVISAKLELKHLSTQAPGMVSIHRLTRDWVEGTKVGTGQADGATWFSHDGTNSWTTTGGDFEATPVLTTQVTSATHNLWVAWEVGPLVADWVAGITPNHGLLIKSDDQLDQAIFASREAADPADAPKLTITYACECGSGTSQSLTLQPGAEGMDSYVIHKNNDSNNGPLVDISVQDTWDLANSHVSLLTFDMSGVPAGASITSAELSLYAHTVNTGIGGSDITVHHLLEPWTESGVTYQTSDGSTPWTWPDNFEAVPEAAVTFFKDNLGWHTWNITDLVNYWHTGFYPNYGLMLHGSPLIYFAQFHSSDYTDPTLHPKLTVSYNCPCGVDCSASTSDPLDVLFVVGDAVTLASHDDGRKTLMESWGFNVILIDDNALQADFDTAAAAADVVSVSSTIVGGTLADKLTGSATGIVNEFPGKLDNFGFCGSTSLTFNSQNFTKTDPGHFITEPFSGNSVIVFNTSFNMSIASGTLAPDLQNVGEATTNKLALMALDTGATGWDGNPAPERRVHLPYSSAETGDLSDDGKTILQRALLWAGGEGAGSASSGPPTITLPSVADTWIYMNDPDTPFGGDPLMQAGANVGWDLMHSMVEFDLSTIPAGATVQAATLRLYVDSSNGQSPKLMGLYQVTADWMENTVTWNSTGGGAFDPAPLTVPTIDWSAAGWKEWDVPPGLIHEWIDGVSLNYGLLLYYQGDKKNYFLEFTTKEHSKPSLHPQLVIEYTEP
jgi:hypothetical protein